MLQQISYIVYFLLWSILVTILFFENLFSGASLQLGGNITSLYTILLVPVLVFLYDSINIESTHIFTKRNTKKIILFLWIVWVGYFLGMTFTTLFFISILLLHFIFFLDSRVSFFLAIIAFLYVMFYLLTWNTQKSEIFSIYAYYFLIIWVCSEVISSVVIPKIIQLWKK